MELEAKVKHYYDALCRIAHSDYPECCNMGPLWAKEALGEIEKAVNCLDVLDCWERSCKGCPANFTEIMNKEE